mmetsp:Transcript_34478/g.89020  ORF Transcript_34478/g.89020 Transcript_34478/m.89020 type:complete len:281 (-) Transcript_34478:21-863(-)
MVATALRGVVVGRPLRDVAVPAADEVLWARELQLPEATMLVCEHHRAQANTASRNLEETFRRAGAVGAAAAQVHGRAVRLQVDARAVAQRVERRTRPAISTLALVDDEEGAAQPLGSGVEARRQALQRQQVPQIVLVDHGERVRQGNLEVIECGRGLGRLFRRPVLVDRDQAHGARDVVQVRLRLGQALCGQSLRRRAQVLALERGAEGHAGEKGGAERGHAEHSLRGPAHGGCPPPSAVNRLLSEEWLLRGRHGDQSGAKYGSYLQAPLPLPSLSSSNA